MSESLLTRKAIKRLNQALSQVAMTEADPTNILLIRHGEAAPRETPKGFRDDPPLSDSGRGEAERLGQQLLEHPPDALYTSPLRRTRETAQIVGEVLGMTPQSREKFREIHYTPDGNGDLEAFIRTGRWSSIDGFETDEALRGRVRDGLDELCRKHPGQRVAVITHMLPINAVLADRLHSRPSVFFRPDPASITEMRIGQPGFFLVNLGNTDHLRNECEASGDPSSQ